MADGSNARAEGARRPESVGPPPVPGLTDAEGRPRPLAEVEADAVRLAVRFCRGNLSEAARRLGIGRSTLYRKLSALPEARGRGLDGGLAGGGGGA